MKKIRLLIVLPLLFLFAGCQSPGPKTFEQQMQYMDAISKFAQNNDMAVSFAVSFNGKAGFTATEFIGIDSGIAIQATLIANGGDDNKGD